MSVRCLFMLMLRFVFLEVLKLFRLFVCVVLDLKIRLLRLFILWLFEARGQFGGILDGLC